MFFKQNRPVPWSPPAGLVAEYPDANRALLKFVQRMMDLDPDNRPSAAELLQDPIFWKVQQLTKRKTPNFAKKLPIVRKHKELMIREVRRTLLKRHSDPAKLQCTSFYKVELGMMR